MTFLLKKFQEVPSLKDIYICGKKTCRYASAEQIHFKTPTEKYFTNKEDALLPHTVGNTFDKNLNEPFLDDFNKESIPISKQLLPHQKQKLLNILEEFSDLWPFAENPIEALVNPTGIHRKRRKPNLAASPQVSSEGDGYSRKY